MYHHIRESVNRRFPGLHFRTVSDFRRQLSTLKQYYEFPDPRDVRLCLLQQGAIPERSCVLTFDDGLRDHYDYVAQVLSEMDILGVFAVNTGPWENGELLPVHMAHLLSAAFSYERLAGEFESTASHWGVLSDLESVPMDRATFQYRYDKPEVARIKFFLNAIVPQELRAAVIGEVFRAHLGDDEEYVLMHYMTPDMVKNLHSAGHTIALHSHWHTHLSLESAKVRGNNLNKNVLALKEAIGSDYSPTWISYPYGTPSSYNDEIIAECAALGCDIGLTSYCGVNQLPVKSIMELARIDTNEVECQRFHP